MYIQFIIHIITTNQKQTIPNSTNSNRRFKRRTFTPRKTNRPQTIETISHPKMHRAVNCLYISSLKPNKIRLSEMTTARLPFGGRRHTYLSRPVPGRCLRTGANGPGPVVFLLGFCDGVCMFVCTKTIGCKLTET